MFAISPYEVDVPMRCWPWMNWVLIALTLVFYPLCHWNGQFTPFGEKLVLGTGEFGWLGHVFVHADLGHLLGNMWFLWLFGNAVCAKVGNLVYLLIYLMLGLTSGVVAYTIDPRPAVGASGAINGVVGMFVVWYPLNNIHCWYSYGVSFYAAETGEFSISSYWMILLWAAFDIWGLRSVSNVGHAAHLAGVVAGFTLAVLLLKLRWIEMDRGERSLLQVIFGNGESAEQADAADSR
jgi:membrane associated rhomboid family serine protease